MIKVNGTREPLEFKSHQWFGASVRTHKGKVVVSIPNNLYLTLIYPKHLRVLSSFGILVCLKIEIQTYYSSGMCSSVPLADSEERWGKGPCGDLLCGCAELQRLRRVLTLQDQWVTLQAYLQISSSLLSSYCHLLFPFYSQYFQLSDCISESFSNIEFVSMKDPNLLFWCQRYPPSTDKLFKSA